MAGACPRLNGKCSLSAKDVLLEARKAHKSAEKYNYTTYKVTGSLGAVNYTMECFTCNGSPFFNKTLYTRGLLQDPGIILYNPV